MESFIARLRTELLQLPGESSHSEAMPLQRPYSSQALAQGVETRESAVGIILYPAGKSLRSILIQRPSYEGTHSDQIAFPGGKRDPGDRDLEFTARRECFEEIQLPLGHGECLGSLTQVYIPVSKFLVQPYVFYVDALPSLQADVREVAEIIHFDVRALLDDRILRYTDMRLKDGLIRKNVPYYAVENKLIWGATAMMLAEFRAILKRF
jgi:8-oxo-dGTP pyrophosphatase MutT (NUDIX family)